MHPRFCGTDGGTGVSAPFGKGMGMKTKRHNQIIEIISNEKIETQEDLIRHLREAGYSVTQATVSRDIKEMGLVKVATKDNTYRYALPAANEHDSVRISNKSATSSAKASAAWTMRAIWWFSIPIRAWRMPPPRRSTA